MVLILSFIQFVSASSVVAEESYYEGYVFRLVQSTSEYEFWTAPPSRRVFIDDSLPETTGSMVKLYAAANEFEPFQLVVMAESSGNVTVTIGDFGSDIEVDIFQVKYVNITQTSDNLGRTGPYPDPLQPIENGDSVSLEGGQNCAFWFQVKIPPGAPVGDYITQVTIGGVNIPVQVHVFNFSIPDTLHIKNQMNFNHNAVLTKYGVAGTGAEYWMYVDMMKQFFIDHRLTPKSVLWSGGLTSSGGNPYIDYNCDTGILSDPHGIWGFEEPAARYLDGTGMMAGTFGELFNSSIGFPSFMAITFQNNDSSQDQRPICNRITFTNYPIIAPFAFHHHFG